MATKLQVVHTPHVHQKAHTRLAVEYLPIPYGIASSTLADTLLNTYYSVGPLTKPRSQCGGSTVLFPTIVGT